MTLKHYIFRKLLTIKDVLREMSERPSFTRPLDKQHGKQSQTLLKSVQQHLRHIFRSLWVKLIWKKSLLVVQKILELLVNKLTPNDKYSLLNRGKLTQPIQMEMSEKQKKFLIYFDVFQM